MYIYGENVTFKENMTITLILFPYDSKLEKQYKVFTSGI